MRFLKILFLFLACSCAAQTNSVRLWGLSAPLLSLTNWPITIETGVTSPPPGFVLMNWNVISNVISTNLSAYTNWQGSVVSNQLFISLQNSNYAAWYYIYTNIPSGLADTTTRTNTTFQIYKSLLSGTNTQSQINTNLTQIALQTYVAYQYFRELIEYLQRLGPGLQGVYNPSNDPAGPNF